MLKVKKFFIIFLTIFMITNTVLVDEVQANAWAFTMAELLAESAGTAGAATLGSTALGIIIPVLVGIAVIYAGYEIVTHREEIWSTFKGWYESSSTVVQNWVNSIKEGIENGTITEGDTITIPQNVIEASKGWVQEYAATVTGDNIEKLNSNIADLHSLTFNDALINSYIQTNYIEANIEDWKTHAPVIVVNSSNGAQSIHYLKGNTATVNNTLVIHTTTTGLIWFDICSWQDLINGTVMNLEGYAGTSGGYLKMGGYFNYITNYNSTIYGGISAAIQQIGFPLYGNGTFPAGNITISGNHLSSPEWVKYGVTYSIDLLIPKDAGIVLVNGDYTYNAPITSDMFSVIATPGASSATNDFTAIEAEYSPNYETNYTTGAIGLSIPLTPDTLNKVGEYIGTAIPETDLISTLDPVGIGDVIVDNPSWLDGLLEGLIGGLQDLLEWLFVPSDAFIDEYVAHCESVLDEQAGILTYPITLVIRFLNEVLLLGETDCIFHLPPIVVFGYTIYTGEDYNFTEEVHRSEFAGLYNVYMTVTDYIMIIAVMSLAIKKGQEIIRGN